MKQLVKMSTLPYYSQVAIFDDSVKDAYPEWDGDNTSVATSAFGVAVATRPDHLGPVEVDVVIGLLDDDPEITEVHDGTVEVRGNQGLLVGSVPGADLQRVPIGPGRHALRVLVSANRDRVRFWLSEATTGA